MLIALVNEGSAPVRVTKLVLNPEAEEVSTGWQHTFDNEGWNFQTGTFLILRARDFKDAANNPFEGCRIPVRMAVIRSKPSDVSWVVMSGAMPTYLHLDMLKCLK